MTLMKRVLLLACIIGIAYGDVFTAMVDLENLLTSESDVTSSLIENYITAEKNRLDRLQK